MENNHNVDPNKNTEFKPKLNIGDVVIVDYTNSGLNYNNLYVSFVTEITKDKCRLDKFNIDFEIPNTAHFNKSSALYNNREENIYAFVYKVEDFEERISYFDTLKVKEYKALVEALKLQLELLSGGKNAR